MVNFILLELEFESGVFIKCSQFDLGAHKEKKFLWIFMISIII